MKKELKERAIKKLSSPNTKSKQKSVAPLDDKDLQEAQKQSEEYEREKIEGNYGEQMVQENAENMEHTESEEKALEQMIRHDEEKTAQVTKDLTKSDKTAQEKM